MFVSLLILLPVVLLFISALGIAILNRVQYRIGWSWIWASLAAIVSLGIVLFLRFWLPVELRMDQWQPFGNISQPPIYLLDYVSWPYALSISALLLAVLFSDSARLQQDASPVHWILSLTIGSLGLLAVMAYSPLTLVLVWTLIDLLELVAVFNTTAGRRASQTMILTFSVRVAGTLLVMLSILLSLAWGVDFTLNPIPPRLAFFMLLAVGLRLGVLPLNLPYTREVYSWRGLGNMLRMIGPASALMVLGRMPVDAAPPEWKAWFMFLSALAALFGSAMWLGEDPKVSGRPYMVLAMSALAIGCVIRGNPQSSIVWGTSLVLSGSVLFLYSAQNRRILFIPLLAVLTLTGLPFTPSAQGWQGLITAPFDFYSLLFIVAILMVIWGYLRRVFSPREELYVMERWIHTIYPAGLLTLIVADILIEVSNWRGAFIPGPWLVSLITFAAALLGWWALFRWRQVLATENARVRWVVVFGRQVGRVFSAVFRLGWLYRGLSLIYRGVQKIVQLLGAIFDGDGGLLWAMVVLALVISMLVSGGAR